MEPVPTRHPVLRYLAVIRSARDFGLADGALAPLALRFSPDVRGSVDAIAEAAASALLGDAPHVHERKDRHALG